MNMQSVFLWQVTWAPGSGIKQSKFLKRWDVELGATYIPWDKLPYNMEAITQGGILDTNSMPPPVVSANAVLPESKGYSRNFLLMIFFI